MIYFLESRRPCGCIIREAVEAKDESEGWELSQRKMRELCPECAGKLAALMIHKEEATC